MSLDLRLFPTTCGDHWILDFVGMPFALRAEGYECFTGTADVYVYFFERGVRLLAPAGTPRESGNLETLRKPKSLKPSQHLA